MSAKLSPFDPDPLLVDIEARDCLYRRALVLWGEKDQWGMVQEECAELIASTSQFLRRRASKWALAEEVADVEIMIEQARLILGTNLVDAHKEAKLKRLRQRIEDAEETVG